MSVAGWKKKKQTVWILLGAAPFMVCTILLLFSQIHLRREIKLYKQKVEQKTYSMAYCLKNEKKAGELIYESDLEQITLSADVKQELPTFRLKDVTGKIAKVDMKKGSIVSEQLLAEKENAGNDSRICTYSEIAYSGNLKKGSYADIRISFPNGEDYIVARHKELLAVSEEEHGLTFCLGESELLRLSSALVDTRQYEDTEIYAVAYQDNLQESSLITYPMNTNVYVLAGWDPNIVEKDGLDSIEDVRQSEGELRQQLEKNLEAYQTEKTAEWKEVKETADETKSENKQTERDEEEFFP